MRALWNVDIQVGRSMLDYISRRDDREKAKLNFDRALSGEHFTLVEAYGEEGLSRRYYEDVYSPILDDQGIVIGLTLYLTDITEQKRAQDELAAHRLHLEHLVQERTHDLERSNLDLKQFASVASHELKSPLRRISSFVDLLVDEHGSGLPAEAHEYLEHIVEGVQDFREVVDSLLVYSLVETDHQMRNVVDPNVVVAKALRTLTTLVKSTRTTVTVERLPSRLVADPTLLRQVFENLVSNAIKFNTTGRGREVSVRARRGDDWEFIVTDNGPGLDPDLQEKVFAMFQRLRPDVEGTGIGLALCKKIVGIHRGNIWYEPGPEGVGTAFHFTIPAHDPGDG
jgi:light-regulated signal transduction histidine kinase (bacteriophytochrome)